jgi:Tfp pilus assembly protein PilF
MQSRFLYGVASFEVKDYPEAKSSFNEVIENKDNYFIEDANWFLAMCYVETGENSLAREQLLMIKDSSSRYRGEARRVLRRLRQ